MANLKEQLARKLEAQEIPTATQTTEQEADTMAKDSDVIQLRPMAETLPTIMDTIPSFALSLPEAKSRVVLLQQFVTEFMKAGVDYGIVPGTDKPTLLKPGAEKLCEIYGFSKFIDIITQVEDWELPLFAYIIKVRLINKRTGLTEAEGVGAANSRERKYIKLDTFSLQNTLLKMAKKRALVDAVLSATRSSGIFTQDIEDFDLPQQPPIPKPPVPSSHEQPNAVSKTRITPTVKQASPVAANSEPRCTNSGIASEPTKRSAALPMTDRQRNMLMALVNQKKLDSDAVATLLFNMFGHSDGATLSKIEASKFIEHMLHMK